MANTKSLINILMFSGSNSGPNLKNTVEITAAYIYLAPQDEEDPKNFTLKLKLMAKWHQKPTKYTST